MKPPFPDHMSESFVPFGAHTSSDGSHQRSKVQKMHFDSTRTQNKCLIWNVLYNLKHFQRIISSSALLDVGFPMLLRGSVQNHGHETPTVGPIYMFFYEEDRESLPGLAAESCTLYLGTH